MSVRGGGGGGISAGTAVANGVVSFANSNGVTFGVSGGTLTATVNPGPAAGIGGIIAGTQTLTSQSVSFVNSNGISFGLSNSTNLTASYNSTQFAGTGTTFGGTNISGAMTHNSVGLNLVLTGAVGTNTTFAGNGIAGSMTINTAGVNLSLSASGGGGVGLSAGTQSVSTGTVAFANSNGLTFGMSGSNQVTASYNSTQFAGTGTTFAGTNNSASMTLNSAGLNLAMAGAVGVGTTTAGTNASISMTLNSAGLNLAISGAAAGTGGASSVGLFATSNTTQSSSGTAALSSMIFAGAGAVSVGASNGSVVISAPGTVALTQFSGGFSTGGNTAGNTGLATAQLVLVGGSNITLSGSTNGGSMTATIIGASGGAGGAGISAGTQSVSTGTVAFANSNGVTFGMSGSNQVTASYNSTQFAGTGTTTGGANISASMTLNSNGLNLSLSGLAAGGASTVGLFATGNTTQNSTTTLANSSLLFNGLGALSVGFSNGSIDLSAPSVSTISGINGISVSVNGSTISVSGILTSIAGANGLTVSSAGSTISVQEIPLSRWIVPDAYALTPVSAPVNASASFQYINVQNVISGSRIDLLMAHQGTSSAANTTGGFIYSAYAAIYTVNGSSLSSLSSGSTQTTYTYNSNTAGNTWLTQSNIIPISVPVNFNMTGGEYIIGFNFITAATGSAFGQTWSVMGGNDLQSALNYAELGSASAASVNLIKGKGVYSAASTGLAAAYSLSGIVQTGSSLSQANVALVFRNF
jgi:hypothetical protein